MSQETPLNKLGGGSMNQEDSQLVDSILNDLNSGSNNQGQQGMGQQGMGQQGMGQQGMGQQGMTEEQHRMMLAQRQQEMMEQQAMMQQALMQEEMQKQKMNENESILDSLQAEWKSILLIIVLSVFMNTGFIEGIFKSNENTYFVLEDGSLNIQAHIVKAFIIGGIFFLAKKYM
jgi:hypothetical protein